MSFRTTSTVIQMAHAADLFQLSSLLRRSFERKLLTYSSYTFINPETVKNVANVKIEDVGKDVDCSNS